MFQSAPSFKEFMKRKHAKAAPPEDEELWIIGSTNKKTGEFVLRGIRSSKFKELESDTASHQFIARVKTKRKAN